MWLPKLPHHFGSSRAEPLLVYFYQSVKLWGQMILARESLTLWGRSSATSVVSSCWESCLAEGWGSPSQPQGGRWFFSLHRVTDLCGFRSQASRSTDRGGGSRIGHAVSKEAQGSFCWSLLHSTGCVCALGVVVVLRHQMDSCCNSSRVVAQVTH